MPYRTDKPLRNLRHLIDSWKIGYAFARNERGQTVKEYYVSPRGQQVLDAMGVEVEAGFTYRLPEYHFEGIWKRLPPENLLPLVAHAPNPESTIESLLETMKQARKVPASHTRQLEQEQSAGRSR